MSQSPTKHKSNMSFSTEEQQSPIDYVLLILLAAIWGGSFMMIKVAVDTVPPLTITAGRLFIATIFLLIVTKLAQQKLPKERAVWGWAMAISIVGNALPFTLIGWGETKIDSGLAAILMAIVPIITIILAHFFTTDEKLTFQRIIGICIGFAGVVYLIGASALSSLGDEVLYQLAVASGAVCYAISSIINRKLSHIKERRAVAATIMICSCFVSIPLSLLLEQPWTLTPSFTAILSIFGLGILSTALAQLLLLRVVKSRGAGFMSLNNYMVPLFGILWGMIFLGESLNPNAFVSLCLIMLGVVIINAKRKRR